MRILQENKCFSERSCAGWGASTWNISKNLVKKQVAPSANFVPDFLVPFAVKESLVRNYLERIDYLNLKKAKRTEEKRKKKEADMNKTYDDYDWVELFHNGELGILIVPVLDLFLDNTNNNNM